MSDEPSCSNDLDPQLPRCAWLLACSVSRKDASPQSSASARRIPGRILSGNGVHRFRNHCSTSPEYAIFWNKLDCDAPWLPSASREVMNLAADFGVRNGVSFPLHTPQGEHGILSFISKEKSNSDLMFENVPLLSFCASYIFNSALTLIKARPDLMKYLAELSDREKECLFWASEGKTSWEIATILGISERTVNFHLNQVTNKTDSRNRNQAIAKSISSGIIVPSLDDVTITNLRLS
ncbi:helix-turn-helix transcriptional regulator [Aeromonas caviae]|uniref:LuxR C-terminal-related transcriptional regulator n=1 Tax=Aeromonas caviae TaxID=648 RepID=A0ABU5WEH9_AERCA|nr:LuxR C-terminal-related transcriptional regulator [Aeromonas caviae]MEA9433546.1 LuxR C-terminal-related transcriptional regulator [Aeromonas caviae]MEA9438223.1 LuxR C-terminal-related transcriptional regulator [Aeromonas caviae]